MFLGTDPGAIDTLITELNRSFENDYNVTGVKLEKSKPD